MRQDSPPNVEGIEFRLIVWRGEGEGWHARVVAPDHSEREFDSPFELARFVAWPGLDTPRKPGRGLR
jgi:hypothetical protein